jgi:hypothetical protein
MGLLRGKRGHALDIVEIRYDQLANSFLGMAHLATARYWLKFVHAA